MGQIHLAYGMTIIGAVVVCRASEVLAMLINDYDPGNIRLAWPAALLPKKALKSFCCYFNLQRSPLLHVLARVRIPAGDGGVHFANLARSIPASLTFTFFNEKEGKEGEERRKHAKFSALPPPSLPVTFHDFKTPFLNGYCRRRLRRSVQFLSQPNSSSPLDSARFFGARPARCQPIFAFRIRNGGPRRTRTSSWSDSKSQLMPQVTVNVTRSSPKLLGTRNI